ncbi:MAG: oxidative damage protection protein [Pseudomonadota bacterium]|nr:oxidative damage protection protein [Pseudomonadota bacterium]
MSNIVHCVKLDKEAEGLETPPWPGELGRRIHENISKEAWQEWLRQQTILINEHRLSPLNPEHKQYLAAQMEAYLFGGEIETPEGWRPEES